VVANPFARQTRFVQYGAPLRIPRVEFPNVDVGPQWMQIQQLLHDFNFDGAQQLLTAQLQQDPSLSGLVSVVSTAEHADMSAPVLEALRGQALDLAQTQVAAGSNEPLPLVAVARFSLDDGKDLEFRAATQQLVERFPDNYYGHFFNGVRKLKDNDFEGAEQSLRRAKALGMAQPSLADMLKVAIDNQEWIWEYAFLTLIVIGAWLGGLVVLFVTGKLLSARTLKAVQRHGPEPASAGERWLRRVYAWIINLAGIYYYLSLPVVVLLALALPLSLGYGLLMVPWLNLGLIGLVLCLGLGGLLTALNGLRTAFVRVRDHDFGRNVSPKEWPAVWQVVREVAERAGTRCVDEIWVLPNADIAVIERGGLWRRLRNRGRRILILGLGAMEGLKLDAFKCILAHEYGHFRNRDTAGGDVSLRVNLAMRKFADAVAKDGKVRWWHVAVHFLRAYHFLFRRLTFGASRLQEVLADRVAVLCYGPSALTEGLTHVIRRAVEFQREMGRAVRDVVRGSRPAMALYQPPPPPALGEREQIEVAVKKILDRPTDADDSHPSPKDRFALAARVGAEDRLVGSERVWDLLAADDRVLKDMRAVVGKVVGMEAGRLHTIQGALLDKLSWNLRFCSAPQGFLERARIYMSWGQYDKAVEDLSRVLRQFPSIGEIRFVRALAYQELELYDLAAADLTILVQQPHDKPLTDEDRCCLYTALGDSLSKAGRFQEAVQAYQQVLESNATSLVGLTGRGRAYGALGEHELALKDLSAAIEHWPNSPEAYVERARIHDAMGCRDQAQHDRDSASSLNSGAEGGVVQTSAEPMLAFTL
jgi:tetratricopeptide (TPR) repeat protein